MAKAEISWKRLDAEGERLQVYAQRTGGRWIFFERYRRYDQWQPQPKPPLEDWLELLDAVRRRVPRKKFPPAEVAAITKVIRELFPDADVK